VKLSTEILQAFLLMTTKEGRVCIVGESQQALDLR